MGGRWRNRCRVGLLALLLGALMVGGACDIDSFLDPSEVGRYEYTPVVLPILKRLDVIDEPAQDVPGLSAPRSEDLIPEVKEYVMGPGDLITVTVFELITPGVETVQTRRIDELGYIRLPVVGQIKAAGLSTKQLEQKIVDILDPAILRNPMVTVVVQEGRQRTFNLLGTTGAGTYTIVQPNFRLLDALALGHGLPPGTEKIYVIRQVPLSELYNKGFQAHDVLPGASTPPMHKTGEAPTPTPNTSAPGASPVNPSKLIESLTKTLDEKQQATPPAPGTSAPTPTPAPAPEPSPKSEPAPVPPSINEALESSGPSDGRYVNINGKWVLVKDAGTPAATPAPAAKTPAQAPPVLADQTEEFGQLPPPEQLVTQRVIEVDAVALMRGDARYNVVIRPGDVIHVPDPVSGNVYIGGSIARPGTYALPPEHQLTLKQLVIAAGGLSPVAIPERVDLIRRLGDHEATVRLNLRAIFDGIQPDIYLKPNDTVTVGTNIMANFLAVTRNAFRMTYGFGFLMDRNFGSDVFGPEPVAEPR